MYLSVSPSFLIWCPGCAVALLANTTIINLVRINLFAVQCPWPYNALTILHVFMAWNWPFWAKIPMSAELELSYSANDHIIALTTYSQTLHIQAAMVHCVFMSKLSMPRVCISYLGAHIQSNIYCGSRTDQNCSQWIRHAVIYDYSGKQNCLNIHVLTVQGIQWLF